MAETDKLNHAGNTDKVGSVGLLALVILLQIQKITSKTKIYTWFVNNIISFIIFH